MEDTGIWTAITWEPLLYIGGRITSGLQFNRVKFDPPGRYGRCYFYVLNILFRNHLSCTVILPPTVRVLCLNFLSQNHALTSNFCKLWIWLSLTGGILTFRHLWTIYNYISMFAITKRRSWDILNCGQCYKTFFAGSLKSQK